jgi:hypothetical protein
MNMVQAKSLLSSNTSERVTIPVELAVVCLWSTVGLLLTALFLALGFGAEIERALAAAG